MTKLTPEQAKSTLGWIKIQCDSQLKKEIDRIINYIESLAADAELGSRAKNIYKACLDCTKNNEPDDVKVRRVEAFIDNELVLYRLRAKLEAAEKEHFNRIECERKLQESQAIINCHEMSIRGLEKERDNLQAQLNGMTEARDTFYNDMLLYKKSCDDLIKFRDELFGKIDKLTANNTNLQAAYEVVRGALEEIQEKSLNHGVIANDNAMYDRAATRELIAFSSNLFDIADKALSTTPPEAGERVRNVVIALDSCLQFIEELKGHGFRPSLWCFIICGGGSMRENRPKLLTNKCNFCGETLIPDKYDFYICTGCGGQLVPPSESKREVKKQRTGGIIT